MFFLLACQPDHHDKPSESVVDTAESTDSGDTGETAENPAFAAIREAVAQDLKRSPYASGASVAIWYQGKIIFAEGFGSAHPEKEQEVLPTTLFQIGSDTKKLTAIALLQEVEAGNLALDTSLAQALPQLQFQKNPSLSSEITPHHLISHQTALYDYTPWSSLPDDGELASVAYGRFAENEHGYAPPGSYWNYSNPNFSLAGLVVEETEGRPYADVLEEKVLRPLGLEHSYARQSEVEAVGDYATGKGLFFPNGLDSFETFGETPEYEVRTVEMSEQSDNAFIRPAGLVWSTASDMAMLGAFLIHGNSAVLSDSLREQMVTPQALLNPTVPGQYYGYGMMLFDGFHIGADTYIARPLWEHGGNTMTMTSAIYVLPEDDFVLTVLSNGYGDNFTNTAVTALQGIVSLPAPSEAPAVPEASDLESYVGTWEDPNGIGSITLTWVDDHLEVSVPSLEAGGHKVKSTLTPAFKDVFYLRVDNYDYDVTFVDGADGTPHKYLRNRQFGGTLQEIQALRSPEVRPFHLLPPLPDNRLF